MKLPVIDENWVLDETLRDGTAVRFRLVRPFDKGRLRRAFEKLSPFSRFRRFWTVKDRLTPRDLRFLTELDQMDHLAIGAGSVDDDPRGYGIARFIRLRERPDVAEVALTIADDAQGRGLGTRLLELLAQAARERGVSTFRYEVLPSNESMLVVLRALYPGCSESHEDGQIVVEAAVSASPEERKTVPGA